MQSEQMKVAKRGDAIYTMPEMEQVKEDFNQFTHEADKTVANLKQKELAQAIKKQAEVMDFLAELLHGE